MKKLWRNSNNEKDTGITPTLPRLIKDIRHGLVIAIFLLIGITFSACRERHDGHAHSETYTCPMHPTVISDRPGTCPVCAMDLVRKARTGEELEITEDLAKVLKSPNEVVITSVKRTKGTYKKVAASIEVQGIVTYDTRTIHTIPSTIGGRLEKVYITYPFQRINRQQIVAEIYSPELVTAQRELIFLIENDSQNSALIASAKQRLRLLGTTEKQIEGIVSGKKVQNRFAIYSPYDGYIVNDLLPTAPQISPAANSMSTGMSSAQSNTASPPTTPELPRVGNYVSPGQSLFKVVSSSSLRIELNIPAAARDAAKSGNEIKLDFGDGNVENGVIDFVQPFFNEGQEFSTVRVYTMKTENLRVGQLVKATVKTPSVEALWVPSEAVLDLGTEHIVFVFQKNAFIPKKVSIGIETGGEVEIKHGISSADEIAANAHYLVDSESSIKF